MKGAPEYIANRCATIALKTGNTSLTTEMMKVVELATEKLANSGNNKNH